MAKILIVDDEKSIRNTLRDIFEFEGYEIDEATDGVDAVSKVKKTNYDLILLDINMPNMDGMDCLDRLQLLKPDIPVIMISGHGTIDTAVEAVKKGAFDFVSKPPELNRLLITARNAIDKSDLVTINKTLSKTVRQRTGTPQIVGESQGIARIQKTIDQVAGTAARVLITGENGTGKELVARWIHEKSERKDKPLVEVNCAAIPAELIESELFGHEKGAFTSAHKQRIGKFEQAHEGTLFLDEIGDMSLSAQAKVLRALQEHQISRVGGDKSIKVDVRVVAATNKDLKKEIAEKRFREDLYHRIAVIIVEVPALRERRTDIPLLVEHFIEMISSDYGIKPVPISDEAVNLLQAGEWSGNIRELRNVIERLIILCRENGISAEDVEQHVMLGSQAGNEEKLKQLLSQLGDPKQMHEFVDQHFGNIVKTD